MIFVQKNRQQTYHTEKFVERYNFLIKVNFRQNSDETKNIKADHYVLEINVYNK